MTTIRNKFREAKTIQGEGNNGVFHNVYFYEDGRIESDKVIDGRIVCTYDWKCMSRKEVERMASESGHQAYTLFDEVVDEVTDEIYNHHERRFELKAITAEIAKVTKFEDDPTGTISVWCYEYDNGKTEYEVNVTITDSEGEYIYDVASDIYSSEVKAFARARHLTKKLSERFAFVQLEKELIHGVL